jgi:hypothetical protein
MILLLKRRLGIGAATITLVIVLLLWYLGTEGLRNIPIAYAQSGTRTYTTNFPLTENPISEGGNWINGGAYGFNNVQTTGGFAGGVGPASTEYADPVAFLGGTWGPNQTVQATVYSVGTGDTYYQEVELHLRMSIGSGGLTGYEIDFRTPNNGSAYVDIVRWNGVPSGYSFVGSSCSYPIVCAQVNGIGVSNGDVLQATISGSTINVYINGTLIATGTDSTYATGAPGIGFDFGCANTYGNFGFTNFTATDGVAAPTNLSATVQ